MIAYLTACEIIKQTVKMRANEQHHSIVGELLHNTAELVDKMMDVDEGLCETFSTEDLIQGVLEASKQIG